MVNPVAANRRSDYLGRNRVTVISESASEILWNMRPMDSRNSRAGSLAAVGCSSSIEAPGRCGVLLMAPPPRPIELGGVAGAWYMVGTVGGCLCRAEPVQQVGGVACAGLATGFSGSTISWKPCVSW